VATFGPAEIPRVLLVRPDVRDTALAIMGDFERAYPGLKLFVPALGGYRSDDEQLATYERSLKEGFRAAPPGKGAYHTRGAAIDLQIVGTDQDAERDQQDPRYVKLGDIIRAHGYRAGLYFTSGQPDPYHLDTGEPWDVVEAKWSETKKKIMSLSA
jgi:D-alanyl-D-alanine dipeptidase